ncbi:CHASE2 domain-containing protein [Blastomonas aquatica]|uniref:histidine kinase n=1 Tax=Blastomonas aquatica TaxID=1510276 RepID=A0ABQ1J9J7_9SPHN|nr:CHASE2 domain-containing protein [Blastomonas aquatica]GGB63424.1 histidine kinase [Blastomonas aquatica]
MNESAGSAGLRHRFQIEWAIVALIASAIITAASIGGWTRPADDLLYDAAMRMAPAPADGEILIVAIDEASLSALGRWPWPRRLHAQLLEQLAQARPASVTLDVLLSEPSADDALLAGAIGRIDRAYLPVQFVQPGRDGRSVDRIDPAPVIARAADGLGHANTTMDRDGTVRSARLCFQPDGAERPLPHLMTLGAAPANWPACRQPQRLRFAAPESFATISFASVLRGEVPDALITGRRVLIGMTAQGLGDRYPVPSSDGGNMPGVEINANIANAQLQSLWVRQPSTLAALGFALLPAWLLLLAFWRVKPRSVNLLVAGLALLVLVGSIATLTANLWIAPGPALLGLALVYPLWGWRRLQATSDYMGSELARLEREDALPIGDTRLADADLVTGQSNRLSGAIGQLRDLRRFVGDTLAGLPDPALVSDGSGKVVLTNAAADAAFGAQLLRTDSAVLLTRIAGPNSSASLEAYLADPNTGHIEFTARDGRCFVLRRAPILDARGAGRGHIDYLTDITAIAAARQEREEMLQLLSHDMRGPQAAILALVATSDGDIDRARIARHARHTLTLADNFVDLARMHERPFDPEPLIAADLVSEAADSLWPVARQRGVQIVLIDNSDTAFIAAERESLFRALVNLFDNAVKYSPEGGTVTVHLRTADGALVISTADQGEGIDAVVLPQLFQRFASDGRGTGVKGIGLGLNYVAAVIERHGGTIAGSNADTGGAVFTITLPLEEQQKR